MTNNQASAGSHRSEKKPGVCRVQISVVALGVTAVGAWLAGSVYVWGAPGDGVGERIRATQIEHMRLTAIDDRDYERDPGLRIRGQALGSVAAGGRVLAVESRAVAATLSRSLQQGVGALPLALPVTAETQVGDRGVFDLRETPLGRYSVYVLPPDRQPTRYDGVTVRDSVGGGCTLVLRPVQRAKVRVPSSVAVGSRILPLYAGHWPDLGWRVADGAEFEIEHRDPDGWPQALLWHAGEATGWLRVVTDHGAEPRVEPCALEQLTQGQSAGPVALATSPFAVLGLASRKHVGFDATPLPSPAVATGAVVDAAAAGGATSLLRIRSREPFAAYEVECAGDVVHTAFADGSGVAVLALNEVGPALVRAQVSGGGRTLPLGVRLRRDQPVEVDVSLLDMRNEREPLFEPRVSSPAGHSLCGFVHGAAGEPVVGAMVAAYSDDPDESLPRSAATNAHGFFRIDGMDQGRSYTLRYGRSAAFGDALLQRQVPANTDLAVRLTRVDLQLSGGSCRVPVPAGQVGDLVLLFGESEDQPLARAYLAEDGGVIEWRDLPRASYRLVLERDSVPIAEVTLAPRATGGDGFAMPRDWRSL